MANQPYPSDPRSTPYVPDAETVSNVQNSAVRTVEGNGVAQESRREDYVDQAGNHVENRIDIYEDKNLRRATLRYWVTGIVYFVLGVLEVILSLRFVFRLLGANQGSAFVAALYNISHVFVGPFDGIFNDQAIGSSSVFEVSTLVAMLIYALIFWGLVSLARVLLAPTYGGGQRVSTWRRSLQ
jgi:hypothetical protein